MPTLRQNMYTVLMWGSSLLLELVFSEKPKSMLSASCQSVSEQHACYS